VDLKSSPQEPELSIVIPAYNEEQRIGPTLERIRAYISGSRWTTEVIVVDDGSSDGTARVVETEVPLFRESGMRLALVGDGINRGKGASVRIGMMTARGRVALFTDADLSAPIEEAPKLVEPIVAGETAVAIGSRGLDYGLIGTHQSKLREFAGRSFNRLMRLSVGLPFKDTQCGFKAFRRDAARDVFSRVRIDGFGFDVEALYLARKLGYETREIAVVWNHVDGTKVSMIGDSLTMFTDLLRVRWNDARGLYSGSQADSHVGSASSLVE
jgi:dolichyl-phosphate beta-glucosyltransferase